MAEEVVQKKPSESVSIYSTIDYCNSTVLSYQDMHFIHSTAIARLSLNIRLADMGGCKAKLTQSAYQGT